MKIIALDYGKKRIGLARAFLENSLSFSLGFLQNDSNLKKELLRIDSIEKPQKYILGLPVNLGCCFTPSTEATIQFAEELFTIVRKEILFIDERLTTTVSYNYLHQMDINTKKAKKVIDTMSAQQIAQGYISNITSAYKHNKIFVSPEKIKRFLDLLRQESQNIDEEVEIYIDGGQFIFEITSMYKDRDFIIYERNPYVYNNLYKNKREENIKKYAFYLGKIEQKENNLNARSSIG